MGKLKYSEEARLIYLLGELKHLEKVRLIYLLALELCQFQAPEILKHIRKQCNWSQEKLANKLNCTRSYICKIENEKIFASPDFLIKLLLLGESDDSQTS
jgi:DNA-binding XRE family transcriptional regulator